MPVLRADAPVYDDGPRAAPDDQLEAAIFTALADPAQPRLVFQPIVDLHSGDVVGYETLSRFVSPLSASPDRWFATANRLGVGAQLQADVLRRGIDLLPALPDGTFLALNLDPRLVTAPEIAELLTGGRLDHLVIELTEQTVARDVRRMLALLDRAREGGAVVAMDEAGAGYTSLQNFTTIRPELVKLDRSLVIDLDRDVVRRSLVDMLGAFVARMGGRVIAEGLEDVSELDACIDLGVALGQGWLLGRPTDDWQLAVPAGVAEQIRGSTGLRAAAGTLAPLVSGAPTTASRDEAVDVLTSRPPVEHVVIVDHELRPSALMSRDGLARGYTPTRPLLVAHTGDRVAMVAGRAAGRDRETRFDPVICCDEHGRVQGIVTIDRLLAALAAAADACSGRRQASASVVVAARAAVPLVRRRVADVPAPPCGTQRGRTDDVA
ncbi:MAG TPA: EAL domain-containing protein [Euzebyales bacterium]|nr:EAL domain-containing protein [Euzebyales bacterium]